MLRAFASPQDNDVTLRPDIRVPVPRQKMCAQRAIARLQFIGQLGGLLDPQYVKLGVPNQYLGGLAGGYNVTFKQTVATAAGFYRVVNGPAVQVDIVAASALSASRPTWTSRRVCAASANRSKTHRARPAA